MWYITCWCLVMGVGSVYCSVMGASVVGYSNVVIDVVWWAFTELDGSNTTPIIGSL